MKINKLQIGSFGKFKDYELTLGKGFNILYGSNEDGKSTLMAFIKMMFYSRYERGRNIGKNPRRKYLPWDGTPMNGAIDFETGGDPYRLQKTIGATPSADLVELINISTGQSSSPDKNEEVGKRFFGLDLPGFERSLFIAGPSSFTPSAGKDELAEKLMSNLLQSGDGNISRQLILNRLNEAIEDLETKSGKKGLLVEARNELSVLYNERMEHQLLEKEQKSHLEEYNDLKEKAQELESVLSLLQCHADKRKYDRLTVLINKIRDNEELIRTLEKNNLSYGEIGPFLKKAQILLDKADRTMSSLEQLKESLGSERTTDAPPPPSISPEEYNECRLLLSHRQCLEDVVRRIDTTLIPLAELYKSAQAELDDIEVRLSQSVRRKNFLESFHKDCKLAEEARISCMKEKLSKVNEYNGRMNLHETECKLLEQEAGFAEERIELLKTQRLKSKSPVGPVNPQMLLILSIVIALFSVYLSSTYGPYAYIGIGGAGLLFLFSLFLRWRSRKNDNGNDKEALEKAVRYLESMKSRHQEKLRSLEVETLEHRSHIGGLTKELKEVEEKLIRLREQSQSYEEEAAQCLKLETAREKAKHILLLQKEGFVREKDSLYEMADTDDSEAENGLWHPVLKNFEEEYTESENPECIIKYRHDIEKILRSLIKKTDGLLASKSCTTFREYEEAFHEYVSYMKLRDTIEETEKEYKRQTIALISLVREYEEVPDFEGAKKLLSDLQNAVSAVSAGQTSITDITGAMGYVNPSLDFLLSEKEGLLSAVSRLEAISGENFGGVDVGGKNPGGVDVGEKDTDGGDYSCQDSLIRRRDELLAEDIQSRLDELRGKIRTPEKNLLQIDTEINDKEAEVKEKADYLESLRYALQMIQSASDEIRQSFGPDLNKRTADIFTRLTGGKYNDMLVDKEYGISVRSGIHYRDWQYLSSGTVDQAYLSLRFAITELISEPHTPQPLFLDDVLIQYDDERLAAALSFLSEYSAEKGDDFQLLLFTCHRHILETAAGITDAKITQL